MAASEMTFGGGGSSVKIKRKTITVQTDNNGNVFETQFINLGINPRNIIMYIPHYTNNLAYVVMPILENNVYFIKVNNTNNFSAVTNTTFNMIVIYTDDIIDE